MLYDPTLAGSVRTPRGAPADPIWPVLVDAGPQGASLEDIAAAIFAGRRPVKWKTALYERLRLLRRPAQECGWSIARLTGPRPTRWALVDGVEAAPRRDVEPPAVPRRPAAPLVSVETVPPIAASLLRAPGVPTHLTGAAAAVGRLTPRCCRWPIGDVSDLDFRFCQGAAMSGSVLPYCTEHRRQAMHYPASGRRA